MAAMKHAMKEQQKDRLGAIRLIQAAFKQKEVDERIEITDNVALVIFDKMLKQRKDSIAQYKIANREDLVQKEQFEITVIQEFMPAALDIAEVKSLIAKVIAETNATSLKDMGRIMEVLRPMVQGRVDIAELSSLIKASLIK